MRKLLLSSVVALAALTGVAQAAELRLNEVITPAESAPNCIEFVPEGANGSIAICFAHDTPGNRRALDEMKARDEVQVQRAERRHAECGDLNPSRDCLARIARELPFPSASPATLAFLAHHGLSWGE